MKNSMHSRPYIKCEVILYTQEAKSVSGYFRDFDRALSKAYKLGHQVSSNGNFVKFEQLIDDIFRSLEADLQQGNEVLDARCAENRVGSPPGTEFCQETFKLTHPESYRFLNLLISLDTLMRSADKLWYAKLLSDSDHVQFQKNWRIKFLNLKKKIEQLGCWKKTSEILGYQKDLATQVLQDEQ